DGDDDVIETEQQIRERLIIERMGRHALQMMAQIVTEIAGEASLEGRQVRPMRQPVALKQAPGDIERIARYDLAVEGDMAILGFDDMDGVSRQKGITAERTTRASAIKEDQSRKIDKGIEPSHGIGRQAGQGNFLDLEIGNLVMTHHGPTL